MQISIRQPAPWLAATPLTGCWAIRQAVFGTGVALVAALLYLQCSNEGETDDRRQRPFYPQPIVSKHATSRGSGFGQQRLSGRTVSVVDRRGGGEIDRLFGVNGASERSASGPRDLWSCRASWQRAAPSYAACSRAILHASDERERTENLLAAAYEPDLFREIRDRFEGIAVPPEEGVITYLNRQGFNPTAVRPAESVSANHGVRRGIARKRKSSKWGIGSRRIIPAER